MSVRTRLDAFQRRHPWAGFPLAVIYKFADDHGTYLCATITYYAFLAIFPLLLLLSSVLGFVLQDNLELRRRFIDSALRQFPVIGEQLGDPRSLRGSTPAVVTGGLVALYGALGVANAVQHALNVAWAVPRHRRPNPIFVRVRGLLLLGLGAVTVLSTTFLSAVGGTGAAFGTDLGPTRAILALLLAVVLNSSLFLVAFKVWTAHPTTFAELAPGALAASVWWQALQLFGTAYVNQVVTNAGDTYGVFALVLGLLAWLYLAALGIVMSAEINVVRAKHLYPRALMTPFTDNVDLTSADQIAYTDAAVAQKAKGFENVSVDFEDEGQHATARRRRPRARQRRGQRGR